MVGRTTKRTFIDDTTLGVAGTAEASYDVAADKVNCSNIWGQFTIEPEDADANSQGSWIMYSVNQQQSAIIFTDARLNDDTLAQYIIAWGVWSATNQTAYTSPAIQIRTTRNLRKDGILALQVHQTGITAGNSSVRIALSCNTTTL